jgi:hypothetical protein
LNTKNLGLFTLPLSEIVQVSKSLNNIKFHVSRRTRDISKEKQTNFKDQGKLEFKIFLVENIDNKENGGKLKEILK